MKTIFFIVVSVVLILTSLGKNTEGVTPQVERLRFETDSIRAELVKLDAENLLLVAKIKAAINRG